MMSRSKILIVEDDVALLKLMAKCLAANGHRTMGVAAGHSARSTESCDGHMRPTSQSLPNFHRSVWPSPPYRR